jgi:hypothetical protein
VVEFLRPLSLRARHLIKAQNHRAGSGIDGGRISSTKLQNCISLCPLSAGGANGQRLVFNRSRTRDLMPKGAFCGTARALVLIS